MSDYEARIYVSTEIILPSLTELKVFVWQNYKPEDINEEGFWERKNPSIVSWDRGGGKIYFEILDEKLKVVIVRSSKLSLMARAAYCIAGFTKGTLQFGENINTTKYNAVEELALLFGEKFDLLQSFQRVEEFRGRMPRFFEHHTPFLKHYAPKAMPSSMMITRLPILYASSTHPTKKFEQWIMKSGEGYINFRNDEKVPDGFFACVQSVYNSQEWAFVLWKRAGRVFWFGSCYFHLYDLGYRSAEITATNLQKAISDWEAGNRDMEFLFG